MRCYCCNKLLSDYEATLRHPDTMEFLDTCKTCLKDIPVTPIESSTIPDDENELVDVDMYELDNDFDNYED